MNGPSGKLPGAYAGRPPGTGPYGGIRPAPTATQIKAMRDLQKQLAHQGGAMGNRAKIPMMPSYAPNLGQAQQAAGVGAPTQPPEPALKVTQYMVDQLRLQVLMFTVIQCIISVVFMTTMTFMDNPYAKATLTIVTATYGMIGIFTIARAWRVFLARIMVLN